MIIDTHQHIFLPDRFTYEWAKEYPGLMGTYTLDEYWEQAQPAGITGALFVEANVLASEQKDEAFLAYDLASIPKNNILGVIASARPEDDNFEQYLDAIAHPALKGVRRVFHLFTGNLPINDRFTSNVRMLGEAGLTFDICALPHQMNQVLSLVKNCPETTFILDHCGIPPIASGEFDSWKLGVEGLALQPNIYCKVSGIVAYCEAGAARAQTLRPWFDAVQDLFGRDRLMFGGDWPVCNMGSTIKGWASIASELVGGFSPSEKKRFWSDNALSVYDL